jgi:small-conductance mechanosensitive channel
MSQPARIVAAEGRGATPMNDATHSEAVAANPPPANEPPLPPEMSERPQYEFDAAQNEVINNLALAILWVRFPLLIAGVLQGLIAIGLAFRLTKDGAHIVGVFGYGLASLICFLLANWLIKAAAAFARVTNTTGRDISHLMTGLKNLGSWFDLLAFFVKMYLILLGVLLVLMTIGLFTGAFKEPPPLPAA